MAGSSSPIGGSPSASPPLAPARSEAVRAAQRAFFEAALAGVQAGQPSAGPTQAPVAPASPTRAVQADPSSPPDRILRPGSLLDIKV